MTMDEMLEIVRELNTDLYDRCRFVQEGFSFSTDGNTDVVSFNGMHIWDSDTDERDYIDGDDDYEPLLPFLKKEFNRLADDFYALKF